MVDWSVKFAYKNKLKGDVLVSQEYTTLLNLKQYILNLTKQKY